MKIAMLSPIAWRTPPVHYGPWEYVVSILTEGLVEQGIDVTLYATLNSQTRARLKGVCPKGYEEDPSLDPNVWHCLHISALFEEGDENKPFGLSVIEAMACGTPVIAIKRGSMPDLILDKVTGFLVKDKDDMMKALDRVPMLDRRECRRWVEERFSKERMVSDYIRVYEEIIWRHGKQR